MPMDIDHNHSVFDRLRFVLVEPSHPGNVGSVARAMRTMGFSQLCLVSPRYENVLTHPKAIALASGALDVLEGAMVVGSIQEALEGVTIAGAVTARLRELSPPVVDAREFSLMLNNSTDSHAALIFGSERFGLPNEVVEKCNYLVNIPANQSYSSLNLAQAVQVLAYECRMASTHNVIQASATHQASHIATLADINGMFDHLERALIAIEFIDPASPKKLMPRLRRLFARTQLEVEEVNILRGIAKRMIDVTAKQI